ncbi:MAG: hypothetical protein ACXWWU_03870 [Candidatus Limnocylindria bacterium]
MSDERLEFELRSVLREIAGDGAPASLRNRVAAVTAQAPARWLWFSPPLRLATAAVAVVAVLVLAFIFIPHENVGPPPSTSPSPSGSVESIAPSATPTSGQSPSATPEPTLAPTPTPVLSSWAGLAWGEPFQPFPVRTSVDVRSQASVHDVLQWHGRWVAVGEYGRVGFSCEEAAFMGSEDGVSWAITGRFPSGEERIPVMCPDFVVATPEGLLALAQQRLWSSTDATNWMEVGSPSWRSLWSPDSRELFDVAAGPQGIVALGTDRDTRQVLVAHSSDGIVWRLVDLPAREQAIVRDVAAYPGGFVIVGRDGEVDGTPSSDHPAVPPGVGRAAAWTSSDGVDWTEASVQADRVQGGGMTQLLVGSNGLFAVGINTSVDYYPLGLQGPGEFATAAWVSVDGTSWSIAGALGTDLPPMALLASDGTTMVGLGLRQPWIGQSPTAWASADGQHWSPLAVSGPALDVGYVVLEPQLLDGPPDTALWVLPDGLLALGSGDGVPVDEPYHTQWFRFASALVP